MKDLIQKFKSWKGKAKMAVTSYKPSGISPTHDWRVLLITSVLVLLFLGASAFYFYTEIDAGKLFIVLDAKVDREVKIEQNSLKKAVDEINKRASDLVSIRENKTVPTDPSL